MEPATCCSGNRLACTLWAAISRALFAEFLATGLYVFFGVGSAMKWPSALPSVLQTAITFTWPRPWVVQISWKGSGPTSTPPWTLASRGLTHLSAELCYVCSAGGALREPLCLRGSLQGDIRETLAINMVRNDASTGQAVAVELVLTLQLVLCVFASTDSRQASGSPAAIIGASVAVGHLIGLYFTGCSMNPARSFGPAVVVGKFTVHWIFWVGPLTGAVLASFIYNFILFPDTKTLAERLTIFMGTRETAARASSRDTELSVCDTA
uniref:Aquaporin 6 n=1 Tax=Oryctolagus cuniculus TaxID=9986 RepID=G1TZK9_RABIT